MFDEISCQPIEQLRMTWLVAEMAKVTWSRDESLPKMPLPDTIDHDARGKAIVRLSQPLRKNRTPPGCARRTRDGRNDHRSRIKQ